MNEVQMTTDTQESKCRSKRIASNTIVLFGRMLLLTVINLYTVRLVLKGLGEEDYGICRCCYYQCMHQQCLGTFHAALLCYLHGQKQFITPSGNFFIEYKHHLRASGSDSHSF